MSKYTEVILKYIDGELQTNEVLKFKKRLMEDPIQKNEFLLIQRLDESMRAQKTIESAQLDLHFEDATFEANMDVSDFLRDEKQDNGIAFFISGSLNENKQIEEQIDFAEQEIITNNINDTTKEWVTEWVALDKEWIKQDKHTREIIDFVKSGMASTNDNMVVEIGQNTSRRKKWLVKIVSIAASIILAFGIWTISSSKPSAEELFAEFYEPYPVVDGQTRSNDQQVRADYKKAIHFYKNKEFAQASNQFTEILKIDASLIKIQFLLGVTELETKQYAQAISIFEKIINENGEYLFEAKWYLALSYLKSGDTDAAKGVLKNLVKAKGLYQQKSIDLLKEL